MMEAVFDIETAVAMLEVVNMELDANATWKYEELPAIRRHRVVGMTEYEARAVDHTIEHLIETARCLRKAYGEMMLAIDARRRANG